MQSMRVTPERGEKPAARPTVFNAMFSIFVMALVVVGAALMFSESPDSQKVGLVLLLSGVGILGIYVCCTACGCILIVWSAMMINASKESEREGNF